MRVQAVIGANHFLQFSPHPKIDNRQSQIANTVSGHKMILYRQTGNKSKYFTTIFLTNISIQVIANPDLSFVRGQKTKRRRV